MRKGLGKWGQVLVLGLLWGSAVQARREPEQQALASEQRGWKSAGMLDTSFGRSGKVTTSIRGINDGILAMAVQKDGRIVAGGFSFNPDRAGGVQEFALARYLPDGRLDPSFGSGGVVTSAFSESSDILRALVLLEDGKILAGGSSNGDYVLARYLPDGRLDPSFGAGGVVRTDFFADDDEIRAMALQKDGKIVAVGRSRASRPDLDFSLARYLPDGRLDPSFGNGGKVILAVSDVDDEANAVLILPDRDIVVGGRAGSPTDGDLALVRLDRHGRPDTSFGEGGLVVLDVAGGLDTVEDLVLQHCGKIVAVGSAVVPETGMDAVVARFDKRGRLDAGFGMAGITLIDFPGPGGVPGENGGAAAAVQKNDRIVVTGSVLLDPELGDGDFGLFRLTRSGFLDGSFGTGGRVTTDFEGGTDVPNAMVLQRDCRIVAGGSIASRSGGSIFGLARFLGAPCN
ncbi:hypothetical protein F0U59_26480 [Archangium gephyra]|nr:hypothetical protein F0U59_26480 [Archangium gephyra]